MSEQIFVAYGPEDLRKKADELTAQLVALDELDEEKKEANKEFTDRRKALSKEIRRLTSCIRNKGEYQDAQAPLFKLQKNRKETDA